MKLALASVGLFACNQVYGLEETRTLDAYSLDDDRDRDGIADIRDNCAETANADQLDSDGDRKGDACDGCDGCMACERAPDHDEDGDKLADGCDACPADPDPSCETGGTLVMFDGFATITASWLEDGPRWTADADRARPDPDLPSPPYFLEHATASPTPGNWRIETLVTTPTLAGSNIGLDIRSTLGAPSCYIQRMVMPNEYRLYIGGVVSAAFTLAPPPPTITLRLGAVGDSFSCELVGLPYRVSQTLMVNYPLRVRLLAERADQAFSYIQLVN